MIDRLMEIPLPARPGGWRRWSGAPLFSHYNRLVALVLVANGWFALASLQLPVVDVQVVSQLVMFNLALAILVRQQYVINGLFWLATRIPVTWPLCIRRHAAKVYHLGAAQRWRGGGDVVVRVAGRQPGMALPATAPQRFGGVVAGQWGIVGDVGADGGDGAAVDSRSLP